MRKGCNRYTRHSQNPTLTSTPCGVLWLSYATWPTQSPYSYALDKLPAPFVEVVGTPNTTDVWGNDGQVCIPEFHGEYSTNPPWWPTIPFVPAGSVYDPICTSLPLISTAVPVHVEPSVLRMTSSNPFEYSAGNSTLQLTPGPPSAPSEQLLSVVVEPSMKLEKTAWMMGFPFESSGRGWRPA